MRNGATLLRNAGGVRLREMVEDIHGGAVLRHQPFRGGFRSSRFVLPLHRPEQPLPNGHKIHIGRHSVQSICAEFALHLVPLQRPVGVANHHFLCFHSPQHSGHGHPFAQSYVWRLHTDPHGPACCPPMHYMVHPTAIPV